MRGRGIRPALLAPALALTAGCLQPAIAAESAVNAPVADLRSSESGATRTAIFAGGCFWGVEGVFSHVKGVKSAVSGYHGGSEANADYKTVSAGKTDHAEAVKVTYDPDLVRYDQLLRIYFSVITDPTQLNRQGPDIGRHYRSAIVPMNEEQRKVAAAYIAQLRKAGLWNRPIVTKIERAQAFYPAESYHQDFMAKNPRHPYIVRWDAPKVAAFRKMHPGAFKASFTRN